MDFPPPLPQKSWSALVIQAGDYWWGAVQLEAVDFGCLRRGDALWRMGPSITVMELGCLLKLHGDPGADSGQQACPRLCFVLCLASHSSASLAPRLGQHQPFPLQSTPRALASTYF